MLRNETIDDARRFLESAPDAMLIADGAGNILLANKQAEILFAYDEAEFKQMHIEDLMPVRNRAEHSEHRERYSRHPTVREMGQGLSICALTKDNREIPIDIRLSPITIDNVNVNVAAIRDVTARVGSEMALEEAKNIAEKATAEKTRFLAAASHDLRQPLQAISLYLSVLDQSLLEQKQKQISAKIRASLDNISDMLSALLDVSKLDRGIITTNKCDIALQPILNSVVAGNLHQANTKGLRLDCAPTTAVIHTDPVLFERIIDNFVTNAIRYTEKGTVSITSFIEDEDLRVEVSDTGIGIKPEELDRVFEEYYQLDNPMRNRVNGLGLGLSIVKHISKLLGHTTQVNSQIGTGSTFSVTVSLATNHAHQKDPNPSRPLTAMADGTNPTILLVDDDPAVLDSTAMVLDMVGYKIHVASNAEDALRLLEDGIRPQLIISDFRLPGQSGVVFIRKAREYLGVNIPAILITGDTAKELEQIDSELDLILHKPLDTENLTQMIQKQLCL